MSNSCCGGRTSDSSVAQALRIASFAAAVLVGLGIGRLGAVVGWEVVAPALAIVAAAAWYRGLSPLSLLCPCRLEKPLQGLYRRGS